VDLNGVAKDPRAGMQQQLPLLMKAFGGGGARWYDGLNAFRDGHRRYNWAAGHNGDEGGAERRASICKYQYRGGEALCTS